MGNSKDLVIKHALNEEIARKFIDQASFVLNRNMVVYDEITALLKTLEKEYVLGEMAHVSLEDFSKNSGIGFNYGYFFAKKGIDNIAQFYELSVSEIKLILGDFSSRAEVTRMALDEAYDNAKSTYRFSFNFENLSPLEINLMSLVQEYVEFGTTLGKSESLLRSACVQLTDVGSEIRKNPPSFMLKLTKRNVYDDVVDKIHRYDEIVRSDSYLDDQILVEKLIILADTYASLENDLIVKKFQLDSNKYMAIISRLNNEVPRVHRHQYLTDDLVSKIEQTPLDLTLMKATLRSYQVFGAKFAVCQKRVIIGDEMGLGKTLQAIAAICHHSSQGLKTFLIICPGSVLINWEKEIEKHSLLETVIIHGNNKHSTFVKWIKEGGVAITTFDTIKNMEMPGSLVIDCLVVDEAHYAKNSYSKRGEYTAKTTQISKNLIFLSGTPLENRVDEFKVLLKNVDPTIVKNLSGYAMYSGPSAFRVAVAPVYLRRNVKEVLNELPDIIYKDEFCTWNPGYDIKYKDSVNGGHYMKLRQYAYKDDGDASTKIDRIREIIDEAEERGLSVIVYSYYLSIANLVASYKPEITIGPLTGATPTAKRLEMTELVNSSVTPKVLVAQIQAGGIGLNIQGASVVILCEPQIKPSLESQAIARSHRMGQLRKVEVHRMIINDSIDHHMVALLKSKQSDFDNYAAVSELSDMAPGYKSEKLSATSLVDLERKRLGIVGGKIDVSEEEILQ